MGINPESKCQFYPPDIPYKTKFLLLKESKECLLLFQESIKLTQELLAAVDEGELAAVVKLLKNPELSSVNVTNKVKREREREGEKEREREREGEKERERERGREGRREREREGEREEERERGRERGRERERERETPREGGIGSE